MVWLGLYSGGLTNNPGLMSRVFFCHEEIACCRTYISFRERVKTNKRKVIRMTTPQPDYDGMDNINPPSREPIFNVAGIILVFLGLFALVHLLRLYFLSEQGEFELLFKMAFIPARYTMEEVAALSPMAAFWSPLTYSLLHADWTHLILNGFWLLAFGSVVATRIGALRFTILFIAGALGGAGMHYIFNIGDLVPMIGASASVSACIGAAVRFAFPKGGRFAMDASRLPRQSLVEAFQNKQVIIFVGIWFLINIIVGVGLIDVAGEGSSVAWQAHIGGFLVGLLLFDLFDR